MENKKLLLKVGDWKLILDSSVGLRLLQPYEFREVPGVLVHSLHMGEPMIDLGLLLDNKPSRRGVGLLHPDGFGILVDEVFEEVVVGNSVSFSKSVSSIKGNIAEELVQTEFGEIPKITFGQIFTTDKLNQINEELKNRRWL